MEKNETAPIRYGLRLLGTIWQLRQSEAELRFSGRHYICVVFVLLLKQSTHRLYVAVFLEKYQITVLVR